MDNGNPSTGLRTSDRPLLVRLVESGEVVGRTTIEEARARHRASVAELPRAVTMMSAGEPVIPTVFEQ